MNTLFPVIKLWCLCLWPLLTSCTLLHELTRPYGKDEVLKWTTNAFAYQRLGQHSQRTVLRDWDDAESDIHYVRRYEGEAPPDVTLVFIHGYPASLFTWAGIIAPATNVPTFEADALAREADLVALDLPGHGFTKSKCCERQVTARLAPTNAAKSVVRFLDTVGVRGSVVLVGHSFGGLVALAAAREEFQTSTSARAWHLTGLLLIDPEGAPRTKFLPSEQKLRKGPLAGLSGSHGIVRQLGWMTSVFTKSLYCYGYWNAEADKAIRQMSTNKNIEVPDYQRRAYARLMRIPENYYSNRQLVRWTGAAQTDIAAWPAMNLDGLRVLAWSDADQLFPYERDGEFFETYFKPTQPVVRIQAAGHIATEDQPEQIVTLLREVVRKLRPVR